MIKLKEGYAKLVGTSYNGSNDYLLLAGGGHTPLSNFALITDQTIGNPGNPVYLNNGLIKKCETMQYSYSSSVGNQGWYRIATTKANIINCNGLFIIQSKGNGWHNTINLLAGISFNTNPLLIQLNNVLYSTNTNISKIRIVYPSSYTNNYAYLEVYRLSDINAPEMHILFLGYGWNIITPAAVSDNVDSGYNTKELVLSYNWTILEKLSINNKLSIDNNGRISPVSGNLTGGLYGNYDKNKISHIWSISTSYKVDQNGADFGNLYGLAFKQSTNITGGQMAGSYLAVWCDNGNPKAAIGTNGFWTNGGYYFNDYEKLYSDTETHNIIALINNKIPLVLNATHVSRGNSYPETTLGLDNRRWGGLYTTFVDADANSTINKVKIYYAIIEGSESSQEGWYRIAKLESGGSPYCYFNFILMVSGGWESIRPSSATFILTNQHATANITQLGGIGGNAVSKLRLTGNNGVFYLDAYINNTANLASQTFAFVGIGKITTYNTSEPTIESLGEKIVECSVFTTGTHAATLYDTYVGSSSLPVFVDSNGIVTACDSELLFSSFVNNINDLQLTIAGKTRSLTVNYATNATNATSADSARRISGSTASHNNTFGDFKAKLLESMGANTGRLSSIHINGSEWRNIWNNSGAYNGTTYDSSAVPASSYSTFTRLDGYNNTTFGTWLVCSYSNNALYVLGRASDKFTTLKQIAYTSDIPVVTNYYWANVKISASSDSATSPTFASTYHSGRVYLNTASSANNTTNSIIFRDSDTVIKSLIGSSTDALGLYTSGSSIYFRPGQPSEIASIDDSAGFKVLNSSFEPVIQNNHTLGSASKMFARTYTRYVDTTSGYDLRLSAAGTERVHITASNGNVGIGTTEPSYKLDVNGGIVSNSSSNINGFRTYQTSIVGATNTAMPEGWYRIAKLQGALSYFQCFLFITGSYSSKKPTNAVFLILCINNTPRITQLSGEIGVYTNIRLVNESGGVYYLEVYQLNVTSSQTLATLRFLLWGNVNATLYSPTTADGNVGSDTSKNTEIYIRTMPKYIVSVNNAVGNATTPVYINELGNPIACTSYANASVNYSTSTGQITPIELTETGINNLNNATGRNMFYWASDGTGDNSKILNKPTTSMSSFGMMNMRSASGYNALFLISNGNLVWYRTGGGNPTITTSWIRILDTNNSSVSKSGETLTVTINGITQSLTNTNDNNKVQQSIPDFSKWKSVLLSYSSVDTMGDSVTAATNISYITPKVQIQTNTGKLYVGGGIIIPDTTGMTLLQPDTSRFTNAIKWLHNGEGKKDENDVLYTYLPSISLHNTGDTDGSIILLPYGTNTNPWDKGVGLYISKINLRYNGNTVLHYGNLNRAVVYFNEEDVVWKKLADITRNNTTLIDTSITFVIGSGTTTLNSGILYIANRWNKNGNSPAYSNVQWVANTGFNSSDFAVTYKKSGDDVTISLYCRRQLKYDSISIQRLRENSFSSFVNNWNYYNNSTGIASLPADETRLTINESKSQQLTTARNITVGNKTNSFNGTSDITYNLQDILIHRVNEFNFTEDGLNKIYFNNKNLSGNNSATKITAYYFGNGQGGYNTTLYAGTILSAATHTYDIGSSTNVYEHVYTRYIDTDSGYNLRICTVGVERVSIRNDNGYVGINNTNPSYQLAVNGAGYINNTSGNNYALILNSSNENETGIKINVNGTTKGWIGYMSSRGTYLYNSVSTKYLNVKDNGIAYYDGRVIVTGSSVGSTSKPVYIDENGYTQVCTTVAAATATDADKLDGQHLSNIIKWGRCYPLGESDKPWHHVATYSKSTNNAYLDTGLVLAVNEYYGGSAGGILTISARAGLNSNLAWVRLRWTVANGINPENFIVTHSKSGDVITIKLWCRCSGWTAFRFTKIDEGAWGFNQDGWILHDALNGNGFTAASLPSGETQEQSTFLVINNTANIANSINVNQTEQDVTYRLVTNDGNLLYSLLGACITMKAGTTTNKGYALLKLGTQIAKGNVNNKYADIFLFSNSDKHWKITADESLTENITLNLPKSNGRLVVTDVDEGLGNTTKPVYVGADGKLVACNTYPTVNNGTFTLNMVDTTIGNTFTANGSSKTYTIPKASNTSYGVIKVASVNDADVDTNDEDGGRYIGVNIDNSGKLYVGIPNYTNNAGTVTSVKISAGTGISVSNTAAITSSGTRTISLKKASNSEIGGIQIGYTLSDKNYPVKLDDSGKAYVNVPWSNTNYYPTSFAWTDGTTSGPTGTLTGTGMSAVSFGAIPSASASASGIVTTNGQTFAGTKTFNDGINIPNNVRIKLNGNDTIWVNDKTFIGRAMDIDTVLQGRNIYIRYYNDNLKIQKRSITDDGTSYPDKLVITDNDITTGDNMTITATAFYESSDIRKKKNIIDIKNRDVSSVRFVEFDWQNTNTHSYGVIAQELESILPELVKTDNDGYKSVNYIGLLILKIKQLESEILNLKLKLNL